MQRPPPPPLSSSSLLLLLLLLCFAFISQGGGGLVEEAQSNRKALFVFGDSYVDTGNHEKNEQPWKPPYGQTWPGKSTGRFSDGRVLTDFVVSRLKMEPPVTYRSWKACSLARKCRNSTGINFAYGGSGVFNSSRSPNNTLGIQVDQLQHILKTKFYNTQFLSQSAAALVVLSGNDYAAYVTATSPPDIQSVLAFAANVVQEIGHALRRLYRLGFRKVAVNLIEPFGCLPIITQSNAYTKCEDLPNSLALIHNDLLRRHVDSLKSEFKQFDALILDFFSNFSTFLGPGSGKDSLKPCCESNVPGAYCGTHDIKTNQALYNVCKNPRSSFFWDGVHPTQHGWQLVVQKLLIEESIQTLSHP